MRRDTGPLFLRECAKVLSMRMPLVVHRSVVRLLARPRRPQPHPGPDEPVTILLLNAYGMGGATRSVFNLAEELARTRSVEILSVVRARETSAFPFPPGVRITVLDDRRARRVIARVVARMPSLLVHPDDRAYSWFSPRTDLLLWRKVRAARSGFFITTRPGLSAFAGRTARDGVVLVAQEHNSIGSLVGDMRREVGEAYRGCDCVVLLTERDRLAYEQLLQGARARVVAIPNAVTRLTGVPLPAQQRRQVVVAAGRLMPQKGFDLLVQAFGQVSRARPDWRLEIYGEGAERSRLAAQIDAAGLSDVISLAGATRLLGEVLAASAVYVLSSRWEGMPMVVLEAMSKGTAVVAYDCPTGPRELIEDGQDGLLVPPEDVDALARALLRVIDDEDLRARLGAAAVRAAERYDLEVVGRTWRQLLDSLVEVPAQTSQSS